MRRKVDLLILLLVLVVGALGVWKAQAIGDWVHSLSYAPPVEVSDLASDTGMSELGTQLFYRFSPEIVSQQGIGSVCDGERLGCTEGRTIYILQAATEPENNRNVVTAAHEMLHVAYSRLSEMEIAALEPLLKAELDQHKATRVIQSLASYPEADYYNEAHSFIGSQLDDLAPDLEKHYAKYFSDRSKTVTAYEASPEY